VGLVPAATVALIIAGVVTAFYAALYRSHPDHPRSDPLWPKDAQLEGSALRLFGALFVTTALVLFVALFFLR
jgi:hypothetical protein